MSVIKLFEKYSTVSGDSVCFFTFDTVIGELTAVADDKHLYMVSFEDSKNNQKHIILSIAKQLCCKFVKEKNKVLVEFEQELHCYLEGKLKKFKIPIKMIGSEFQKDVWNKLLELPYGLTQSYGNLAKSLGRPANHARAVGAACGVNAHLIVIPCHRLVASTSKGGFSSGIDRKEWLLDLEKKTFIMSHYVLV